MWRWGLSKDLIWDRLSVGCELAAPAQIDVPQANIRSHAFEAKFAGASPFADPHHSKLALFFAELYF